MSAHTPALNPEAFVQCPYEENHKIRNKRVQIHLANCRKVSCCFCFLLYVFAIILV